MAADAYIVTFQHDGTRFNVWVWPDGGESGPGVEVNVGQADGWTPLTMVGGAIERVEVQGRLV